METEQLSLVDLLDDMCAENDIVSQPLRFARDIMTKEVRTLTLDHTVNACIKLMTTLRIRHIPIVDIPCDGGKKPYFIGIVSERDVLRMTPTSMKEPGKQEIDKRALRQLLVQLVARKAKTVSPDTPIPEVIRIMLDNHFDMVPVIVETEVLGIITTTDIIKVFFKLDKVIHQLCPELGKGALPGNLISAAPSDTKTLCSWTSQTAQDIMTEQVICLSPQDDLSQAIGLMQEHEFRHIPITDEQGKLQGIISDRDILRHLHYAGRRPLQRQKKFRDHLFRTDINFVNLKMPLENIMTAKVTHISPDSSTYSTANKLYKSRASCFPVVDEQNNLLGIVTTTDLMSALLAIYGKKAEEG